MSVDGIGTASSIAEDEPTAARPGLGWLTLLASSTTLVCCALPIALVTLGFGAAVAALTSALPVLVVLSEHKAWLFGGSAVLIQPFDQAVIGLAVDPVQRQATLRGA